MSYHKRFYLTIVILVFTLEFILTTQVIFSLNSFLRLENQNNPNSTSEIHLLLNLFLNGLTFPNSMMIIPIVAGIVCDAIGALTFQFGSFIIFNIGALIAGIGSITLNGQGVSFHNTMVIQIGVFLIGASYQCVRIGVFVMACNSFIYRPKKDISLFIYALSVYSASDTIGYLMAYAIVEFGREFFPWIVIFGFTWVASIVTILWFVWIIKANKEMMRDFREVQLSWKKWTNKAIDVDNRTETWADRNDIIKDKEENSLTDFLMELGPVRILGIIGLGYLIGGNEFVPYSRPFLVNDNFNPFFISIPRLICAYLFVKVSWDKFKTMIAVIGLFIILTLAYWQASQAEIDSDPTVIVIILFALFRSIVLQIFVLSLVYMLAFRIKNAGKMFGIAIWCVSVFMTGNIVFNYFWIPPIALLLYIPYVVMEIRNKGEDPIRESNFTNRETTLSMSILSVERKPSTAPFLVNKLEDSSR